jgi:hypothetical protein
VLDTRPRRAAAAGRRAARRGRARYADALAARAREFAATPCVGPHARRPRGARRPSASSSRASPRGPAQRRAARAAFARRRRARSRARSGPTRRSARTTRRGSSSGSGSRGAGVHAGRARATATPRCCRRSRSRAPAWSASRPRSATCSARRSAKSRSPSGRARRARARCPHKRNPILTERVTGLARVLRGYAQAGVENVALWHERDISHSGAERVILPDATILLDYMQAIATRSRRAWSSIPSACAATSS